MKKVFLLLVLFGIGIGLLSVFRQELSDSIRPWLERRGLFGQKKEVTLYFSDREAEYLIGEKREIKKKEAVEDEAGELIQELIKGPKGRLLPTLPSRTKLLSLHLDEKGMAKVNFSKALSKDHPGGSSAEMVTVYSVVNSLVLNFPKIKRVQFLVEGREIDTITGHLSISKPVSPRADLIKKSIVK
ncbi:MAG TPA: GerMN domain-containing protein [Thermodesulfobacteriota bacterium]|nr:GerMN domain-containing protein [Thermodesulfobacteriota bacterium]